MAGGHHPGSTIQYRAEVIAVAQFRFTGGNAHPHRQLQPR